MSGLIGANAAGDLAAQAAHVYAFHRKLVAAAGNCVLLRMWESLALETCVRIRLGWSEVDPKQVEASYGAILAALARGAGAEAGRLLRTHAEVFAPPDGSLG